MSPASLIYHNLIHRFSHTCIDGFRHSIANNGCTRRRVNGRCCHIDSGNILWGFLTDTTTNFGLNIGFWSAVINLVAVFHAGRLFNSVVHFALMAILSAAVPSCCVVVVVLVVAISVVVQAERIKAKGASTAIIFSRIYPFITVKVRVFCRIFAIYGNTISMPF